MKPITRLENFLARIAKDPDARDITPKTRKEYYLNEIAAGGGGGSFVIHATLGEGEQEGEYTITADKTPAEAASAISNGIMPVIMLDMGEMILAVPFSYVATPAVVFSTEFGGTTILVSGADEAWGVEINGGGTPTTYPIKDSATGDTYDIKVTSGVLSAELQH